MSPIGWRPELREKFARLRAEHAAREERLSRPPSDDFGMPGRFDYVRYDERSAEIQAHFKEQFETICKDVEAIPSGRATSLAITKLEEAYMWIGKAIRDDQVARNGGAESQESRCCS